MTSSMPAIPTAFEAIRLEPIGVEIVGLDLSSQIAAPVFRELRETIMEEGLVVFRDQPLTGEAQIALGKRFGPIEQLDVNADQEEPSLVAIGNVGPDGEVMPNDHRHMKLITINEGWHTDSSFREVPASFSVFSCVVAPEEGGDTFFASLHRAWETLPEALRSELYGRTGLHDYNAAYRARGNEVGGMIGFDLPPVPHPMVRRHPETGRTGLYVSEHIGRVEGLPEEESDRLLRVLLEHATDPSRVYRHHWSVGDVAIWDNRSMLHRAQGFDERYARVMHHVRVAGFEAPIPAERQTG